MATKITLKQLSDDILDLLNRSGGDASLEKEIISNVAVGAAASGTKFNKNETFTQFAEKILRKDITPSITTNFSGTGTKEVGTIVNGTTMTLTISNLSAVTVPINEVRFYINNALIDSQLFEAGKASYVATYNSAISANITAKAELIYNTNQRVSGLGSFNFVYASYYGLSNVSIISDEIASSYATTFNKNIKNSKAFTWNNITSQDERFCYLYPKSFGALTSIKDGNGFSQIGSYTRFEVNVTSPVNGDIVPYYAYLLTDATTGVGFKQIYE